jgi:serine/threonine protein kinase
MADRVGQQFGNYRLVRLLGRGGFAEVYLGQHLRINTQAAIKVLHAYLADEDIKSFQAEAQTIATLDHPNIVRLYDFDVQNGTPFLVMQYAPNGSLRTRHPAGTRLPLGTVARYVEQVADALHYAHDQRLVHRDVKPENLLLGRREEVLLSDFGLALVVQSSRSQRTQDVTGTIAYMAPEQIQGQPRRASDQYSLGVMVYEWLTGARPFQGSVTEVIAQQLAQAPAPFAERVPGVTPEVEQAVLTALAKDPKARHSSVAAFAAALAPAAHLSITGTWTGKTSVDGYQETYQLTQDGSSITGTGTGNNGRYHNTYSITGSVFGDTVTLTVHVNENN